ncbi:MAG: hypothetical protein INF44_07665, partial [Thalassospira sp.]|nr:hypothetical protein [Thalassospira sp.]
ASPPAAKPTTEAPRLHPAIPPIAAPAVPVRQNPLQLRPVAPAAEPRSSFSGRGNDSGLTEDFLNSSYAKFWDTAFNTRPLSATLDADTAPLPEPEPPKPAAKPVASPQDTIPDDFMAAIQAGLAQAAADAAAGKRTQAAETPVIYDIPTAPPPAAPVERSITPEAVTPEQPPQTTPEIEPEPKELVTQTPDPETETQPEPTVTHWKPSTSGGAMTVLSDFNPGTDRVILAIGALTYKLTEDSGRVALRFSNKDQLRFSNPDRDLTEAEILAALTVDTTIPAAEPVSAPEPTYKKKAPRKKAAPSAERIAEESPQPASQPVKAAAKPPKKPLTKKTTAAKKVEEKPYPEKPVQENPNQEKPTDEKAPNDVERFLSGDIGFDDLF